jgi:hypothetical protein
MKTNRSESCRILGFIVVALLAFAHATHVQTPRFQITAFTDRGGGLSTGGPFSISGTAGQSDIGKSGNSSSL